MSMLPGHDDLKPREVIGVDGSGKLLVDYGEAGVKHYRLFVTAGSKLLVQPYEPPQTDNGVDQIGQREPVPLSKRMTMIDQGA